jgi:uncharacterized protein YndB with AHSA1/START domain
VKVDVIKEIGAVTREVRSREHEGRPARVVVAGRTYSTTPEDVWDAFTRPERVKRWFLPLSGDLRLGGRYQLEGNAGGEITACEPARRLALTWEFGGERTWLEVRLSADGKGGTRLQIEHTHLSGERWTEFGPGGPGVGWDLILLGLDQYASTGSTVDPAAWPVSGEGKDFIRRSSEDWGRASTASGTDPAHAAAATARTTAMYTGEAGA